MSSKVKLTDGLGNELKVGDIIITNKGKWTGFVPFIIATINDQGKHGLLKVKFVKVRSKKPKEANAAPDTRLVPAVGHAVQYTEDFRRFAIKINIDEHVKSIAAPAIMMSHVSPSGYSYSIGKSYKDGRPTSESYNKMLEKLKTDTPAILKKWQDEIITNKAVRVTVPKESYSWDIKDIKYVPYQ